jgi:phosphoglycolate phosphatase
MILPRPMRRLILFDIDGTLVWGGPARYAFEDALVAVFGTAGRIDSHEFSGKTDPQIAREVLRDAGISNQRIDDGMEDLFRVYLRELERRLPETPVVRLPGVAELLGELEREVDGALGLVTGNIDGGARLKLRSAGIDGAFAVGGYGSDHEERDNLPGIAIRRAEKRWGVRFDPASVVVIGDTPLDVACGRRHGTRTVAVATGRFGRAELERTGADAVLDDLTRTDEVMGLLLA